MRDLLIRLANTGLFQARWTQQILNEMVNAILRNNPAMSSSKLDRTVELMKLSVRDCMISNYEDLVETLTLPDPDDRHVLAAAIKSKAKVIVSNDHRGFPPDYLQKWGLERQSPDAFAMHALRRSQSKVLDVVHAQVAALNNPPMTIEKLLERLHKNGLTEFSLAVAGALETDRPKG